MLEIGPGYGYYTQSVAEALGPTGELEILDLRQALLDQTIDRVRAHGLTNVIATRGDAQRLPYRDRQFAGVYLVACLGEIPDRGAVIGSSPGCYGREGGLSSARPPPTPTACDDLNPWGWPSAPGCGPARSPAASVTSRALTPPAS